MPAMSKPEAAFCRSAPWRAFAGGVVLPWALQREAPSGDVLEIGAGSGAMAAELLSRYPSVRITVTDFDAEMVSAAKDRLASFGDRAVCQKVDATALPFADASFDTVLSFIMLHHVGDWGAALGEATRVLRPGGRLIGYDLIRTPLFARLHPAEAQGIGMMRLDLLRRRLDALPVSARLRPGLFGTIVRFIAHKH